MIGQLILVSLALFGLCVLSGRYWRRKFAFEPGYEEVQFAECKDGWRIGLCHYPAAPKRYESPVLLCHGLGANRFNFDLGPDVSLARYLQQQGFDVWSVDLRGRGFSRLGPGGGGNGCGKHVFDDYVRQDAVAAIRHVQKVSGASRVHWIGHSMGGLVLYGVLQGEAADAIASGVAIASPGTSVHMRRIPLVHAVFHALRFLPRIHISLLASGLAPLLARLRLPGDALLVNRHNVDVPTIERALCYLASDISGGELSQFLDWMKTREMRTYDRDVSYEEGLRRVRHPLFLMAGAKDYLVPPKSVGAAYDRIASDRKAFLVLGREDGFEEDYGHGDLLIGKNCTREVFPHLLEWLVSVESS